jgi:acyl-CoA reductase-like NAD-dependent aldehyde dehydrogenase
MTQAVASGASTPAGDAEVRAAMMLGRARWAASAFARFDGERVRAITRHTAEVAFAGAQRYAEWAVRETGFGVVEHKRIKNELCSRGLVDYYESWGLADVRIDHPRDLVELPRPAGVVFALTPSTNPVSTVYFKVLCALMARCAIVISPHPAAKECCADAATSLAAAATEAGAPDGVVQVIDDPSLQLIDAFMGDPRTDVILATGGTAVVRAAYSSSNPAIGVGPGNAPVLVDATADLRAAAKAIIESKTFDNSLLCTSESVLVAEEAIFEPLLFELQRAGAHVCDPEEVERVRRLLFPSHPEGQLDPSVIGQSAKWIAERAGVSVARGTTVLITPIEFAGVDEPLSTEKLCPVLGLLRARDRDDAIAGACAVLRHTGAGHSAAIHSQDPQTVLDYAASVQVLRVAVNVPCSTGAAGFGTNLAPSMTIGTGYFGRSSIGENIGPQHLVNWTRIAYGEDAAGASGAFEGLRIGGRSAWSAAPIGSGSAGGVTAPGAGGAGAGIPQDVRQVIKALVMEELAALGRRNGAVGRG